MSSRAALEVALCSARRWLPWWIALVCAVQTATAFAQERADTQRYRQLIGQALQDFDRGNWEEAGALFAQAHAVNPNARTLRGMGLAAFEARHYTKALHHLRAALDEKRNALTSDQRKSVEQAIERAEQYVGRVRFSLEPAEATLRIDGEPIELDESGVVVVDPGVLEVEAAAVGYDAQVRRVHVNSGATEAVAIKLVAEDAGAETQPAAAEHTAPSPPPSSVVDSGDGERSATIGTLKWVAGGLAVAALATGTIALVLGDAEAKQWNRCLDDSVTRCVRHRDAANTDRTIGVVGLAAGGALAITSVVLFVIDAKSEAATALRACGPGASELSLHCRVTF